MNEHGDLKACKPRISLETLGEIKSKLMNGVRVEPDTTLDLVEEVERLHITRPTEAQLKSEVQELVDAVEERIPCTNNCMGYIINMEPPYVKVCDDRCEFIELKQALSKIKEAKHD